MVNSKVECYGLLRRRGIRREYYSGQWSEVVVGISMVGYKIPVKLQKEWVAGVVV